MRILGVDLGHKRIGLAITDEAGSIAFPAGILDSRGRKQDIMRLRKMIEEKEIRRAVVGLPLHMDGRRGPEAENALRFADALRQAAGIPVDTLDERWTSMEAERLLRDTSAKKRGKARKQGVIDEMAASILLRTYLSANPTIASSNDPQASEGTLVELDSRQSKHGESSLEEPTLTGRTPAKNRDPKA